MQASAWLFQIVSFSIFSWAMNSSWPLMPRTKGGTGWTLGQSLLLKEWVVTAPPGRLPSCPPLLPLDTSVSKAFKPKTILQFIWVNHSCFFWKLFSPNCLQRGRQPAWQLPTLHHRGLESQEQVGGVGTPEIQVCYHGMRCGGYWGTAMNKTGSLPTPPTRGSPSNKETNFEEIITQGIV